MAEKANQEEKKPSVDFTIFTSSRKMLDAQVAFQMRLMRALVEAGALTEEAATKVLADSADVMEKSVMPEDKVKAPHLVATEIPVRNYAKALRGITRQLGAIKKSA